MLELTGLTDEVNLTVHGDTIMIEPRKAHPREGWAEAISREEPEDEWADWGQALGDLSDGDPRDPSGGSSSPSTPSPLSEENEMVGREDLKPWIVESLNANGGRATVVEIARYIWNKHKAELEAAGDMFFKWQYEMRWAGDQLSKEKKVQKLRSSRSWVLTS